MRFTLTFFALFLLLGAHAFAEPLEDGVAAVQHGDYKTALKILQPLAEQNNPEAQIQLGDLYYNGQGVKKDDAVAAGWWLKAAEQGQARAQTSLSNLYATGADNFPQIYELAYFWKKLAFKDTCDKEGCADLVKKLTPEQIERTNKKIATWRPISHPTAREKMLAAPLPDWLKNFMAEQKNKKYPDRVEVVLYQVNRAFEISHTDRMDARDQHALFNEKGEELCKYGMSGVSSGSCNLIGIEYTHKSLTP